MRHLRLTIALWAISSLVPAVAKGQADAQVDPDSPAGVEYQLPLEQARKDARGGGLGSQGGAGGSEGVASLFGVGIVPAKATNARGRGSGPQSGGPQGEGGGPQSEDRGPDAGSEAATIKRSALGSPDEDAGSATLRIAGIALAVLLVGGLLGLALRRGLRQPAD